MTGKILLFDYLHEQIIGDLESLKSDGWSVEMIADAMKKHPSYVYDVLRGDKANMQFARYDSFLSTTLRRGSTVFFDRILRGTGYKLVREEPKQIWPANGSCDDEIRDAVRILSQTADADAAGNPEQIKNAAEALRGIANRLDAEAKAKVD